MSEFIHIEIDTKQYEKQLKEHKNKMPSIAKKMMNKVNTKIKVEIRKAMRARNFDTHKEGGIYKNLFSWASKKFSAGIGIFRKENFVYYAPFVKYGAHIQAKDSKYLCFKVNNQWVKVKEVTLTPKPFMGDLIRDYWNSGKATQLMDEVFKKELQKIYDKEK